MPILPMIGYFGILPNFPKNTGKFKQFAELTFPFLKIQRRDWREKNPYSFPPGIHPGRDIKSADKFKIIQRGCLEVRFDFTP
jgi:hypothetical protein